MFSKIPIGQLPLSIKSSRAIDFLSSISYGHTITSLSSMEYKRSQWICRLVKSKTRSFRKTRKPFSHSEFLILHFNQNGKLGDENLRDRSLFMAREGVGRVHIEFHDISYGPPFILNVSCSAPPPRNELYLCDPLSLQ